MQLVGLDPPPSSCPADTNKQAPWLDHKSLCGVMLFVSNSCHKNGYEVDALSSQIGSRADPLGCQEGFRVLAIAGGLNMVNSAALSELSASAQA